MQKSERVKALTEQLYEQLMSHNIDVLMDDRNERPGVKIADMELIGIPHRVVIGDKGIDNNVLEYRARTASENEDIDLASALDQILSRIK